MRRSRLTWLGTVLIGCLASHGQCQLPADRVIVLAAAQGPAFSTLELVDPGSGTLSSFSRFPSDGLAPRAIAWDPIGDELVVALVEGSGSRVVRLRCQGTTVVEERVVHHLPEVVTDLQVDRQGRLFASVLGSIDGLIELGRRTTDRRLIAPWPRVTSLDVPWGATGLGLQSNPLGDPTLAFVDLDTGVFQSGPHQIPGLAGITLTGAVDLPTGAIRQLVSDDLGRLHLFEFLQSITTLPIQPALPPGGTRELISNGGNVLILGGASSPYLRELTLFQWTTLTIKAGPLRDDPVDMTRTDSAGPFVSTFGNRCGSGSFFWQDQPSLGSQQFALGLQAGIANTPALLVLGASEGTWLGAHLPIELVPNCALLVSVDVLLSATTNGNGGTSISLPIPNRPELRGARLHAQWFQASATFSSSTGLAVRVGS